MMRRISKVGFLTLALTVAACGGSETEKPTTPTTPVAPKAPGAPTALVATAGIRAADLSWAAPADTGGAAVTGYRVTGTPGNVTVEVTSTSAQVTGLENGTTYTFTVAAINSAGRGPESAASTAVSTPDVPGAPQGVAAVAYSTTAEVTFEAPATTGGRPVTGYTVRASPGTHTQTAAQPGRVAFTGLTNGTAYTFTVVAENAVGASVATAQAQATPAAPTTQSEQIGQAGGTLTSEAGLTLTVPAGAVDNATAPLTVTATGTKPPEDTQPLSQVFDFGPDGTVFAHPVQVRLPLPAGVTDADLYWSRELPDGSIVYDNVGGRVEDGVLVAEVVHFSSGFAGAPANVRTVNGSRVNTYGASERPNTNSPTDFSTVPVAALVELADGGVQVLPGTGRTDGTFAIPGVPEGEYWLQVGTAGNTGSISPQYVRTAAGVIDLGRFNVGRPDAVTSTAGTTLELNVTGMTPWNEAIHGFEVVASDARDSTAYFVGNPLGGYCQPERLDAGTTTLSYRLDSASDCYSGIPGVGAALIRGSLGDRALIAQLAERTSDAGVPYTSFERVFEAPAFDMVQGGNTVVSGAFQAVPADRTVSFDVRPESFRPHLFRTNAETGALEPAVGPVGADHVPSRLPAFVGVLAYGSRLDQGTAGASADPLLVNFDSTGEDFLTGGLHYSVPDETRWSSIGEFRLTFSARYRHPDATVRRQQRGLGVSGSMSIAQLAAAPLTPQLTPVRALQVDGQDFMTDRTTTATRPTLSWTAPAAGAPNRYTVSITRLGVNAAGETTFTSVGSLTTAGTSVRLPPDLLTAGNHYFFVVSAVQTAYPSPERAPFRSRLPTLYSTIASGMLTVQP